MKYAGIISQRTMTKVIAADRKYRACKDAGTHPTPSGRREDRPLGGHPVLMERCGVCNTLYPVDR